MVALLSKGHRTQLLITNMDWKNCRAKRKVESRQTQLGAPGGESTLHFEELDQDSDSD